MAQTRRKDHPGPRRGLRSEGAAYLWQLLRNPLQVSALALPSLPDAILCRHGPARRRSRRITTNLPPVTVHVHARRADGAAP